MHSLYQRAQILEEVVDVVSVPKSPKSMDEELMFSLSAAPKSQAGVSCSLCIEFKSAKKLLMFFSV